MNDLQIRLFTLLFGLFVTIFGACVGSFLNVCIYRIPRDESVVKPRSHCPQCRQLIPWYLNIPVFSWLSLRGQCANCKCRISFRYTLVELLTAFLFLMVFMMWVTPGLFYLQPLPIPALIFPYWLFVAGLLLGTFVDFEHYIIPDSVTIGGMVAGPILSTLVPLMHHQTLWWQGLGSSLLGLVTGFALLYAIGAVGTMIFKKEAMGFGDVKLMGAIGAFMGWKAVLFTIFASSLLGSIAGLLLIACRAAKLQQRIPFGPYISLGALIWLFWGERICAAYLKLLQSNF